MFQWISERVGDREAGLSSRQNKQTERVKAVIFQWFDLKDMALRLACEARCLEEVIRLVCEAKCLEGVEGRAAEAASSRVGA